MKVKNERVVSVVDDVIYYLENNREVAANRLFPGASDDYLDEWRARGVVAFWTHLGTQEKKRLVDIAVEHYAK